VRAAEKTAWDSRRPGDMRVHFFEPLFVLGNFPKTEVQFMSLQNNDQDFAGQSLSQSEIHRFTTTLATSHAVVETSVGRLDRARPLICPPAMAGYLFDDLDILHFLAYLVENKATIIWPPNNADTDRVGMLFGFRRQVRILQQTFEPH
jgi:hypothetical protein